MTLVQAALKQLKPTYIPAAGTTVLPQTLSEISENNMQHVAARENKRRASWDAISGQSHRAVTTTWSGVCK